MKREDVVGVPEALAPPETELEESLLSLLAREEGELVAELSEVELTELADLLVPLPKEAANHAGVLDELPLTHATLRAPGASGRGDLKRAVAAESVAVWTSLLLQMVEWSATGDTRGLQSREILVVKRQ